MSTVIAVIAGFLSGLIGSMGFGGGGVLIIYLTVFADTPQIKAQGINLMFFIPCAFLSVIIYTLKKQIKYLIILANINTMICQLKSNMLMTQFLGIITIYLNQRNTHRI